MRSSEKCQLLRIQLDSQIRRSNTIWRHRYLAVRNRTVEIDRTTHPDARPQEIDIWRSSQDRRVQPGRRQLDRLLGDPDLATNVLELGKRYAVPWGQGAVARLPYLGGGLQNPSDLVFREAALGGQSTGSMSSITMLPPVLGQANELSPYQCCAGELLSDIASKANVPQRRPLRLPIGFSDITHGQLHNTRGQLLNALTNVHHTLLHTVEMRPE